MSGWARSAGSYRVVMRRLTRPRRTLLAARFSRKPASRSRSAHWLRRVFTSGRSSGNDGSSCSSPRNQRGRCGLSYRKGNRTSPRLAGFLRRRLIGRRPRRSYLRFSTRGLPSPSRGLPLCFSELSTEPTLRAGGTRMSLTEPAARTRRPSHRSAYDCEPRAELPQAGRVLREESGRTFLRMRVDSVRRRLIGRFQASERLRRRYPSGCC